MRVSRTSVTVTVTLADDTRPQISVAVICSSYMSGTSGLPTANATENNTHHIYNKHRWRYMYTDVVLVSEKT